MEHHVEVKGTPLHTSRISAGPQQQHSYIPTVTGKSGDEAARLGRLLPQFSQNGNLDSPDVGGPTPIPAHYRHTRLCELSADVTKKGNLPVENSKKLATGSSGTGAESNRFHETEGQPSTVL